MTKLMTNKEYKELKKKFQAPVGLRAAKKVFNLALIAEILVMLVFVILLIVPTFFHVYPYSIITASMSPNIPAGSLVYVDESLDNSLYQPNDVIAFREKGANFPIVHRVQSVEDGFYVTKGDANERTENVAFETIIGKEVYNIPKLGSFCTEAMQYKFLFVAITLGTAAMLFVLGAIQSHIENKKRKEYLMTVAAEEESLESDIEATEVAETPEEITVTTIEKVEE